MKKHITIKTQAGGSSAWSLDEVVISHDYNAPFILFERTKDFKYRLTLSADVCLDKLKSLWLGDFGFKDTKTTVIKKGK